MEALPVKKVSRRSKILKPPAFGCLKGTPAINLTRGCLHRCVYCYARSFPETPTKEVHLYYDLAEKLRQELESPYRRKEVRMLTFSTASDLFQPHPEILNVAYRTLSLVLERGIGISFLTKGRLTEEIWALLAHHQEQVSARFGLVSLAVDYHRLFEPYAAPPFLRLKQMEKSASLGLAPAVRLDPIIPGVTDTEEALESLVRHVAQCGVREIAASYLVLRPGVWRQMAAELPAALCARIISAYRGQPWQQVITSATTKLPKRELRERGYRLLREIGRAYGVKVRICGCKNPDLPFESCLPWEVTRPLKPRQKSLFEKD